MASKTKQSLEKAAYTAVGAPIAAVKALGARVSDLRDAVRSSRGELSEDLAKEFDTWVAEGERVVNQALERLRKSGAIDRARTTTQKMKERVEISIDEMSDTFDIVEPERSLELIRGIGPSTSERLASSGVTGINSFLARTSTQHTLEALAESSGLGTETIAAWRMQVDLTRVEGVGDRYQRLLHRLGIWTVDQLAEADAESLSSDIAALDLPGMPEHLPGMDQVSAWIGAAKKLRWS